MSQDERNNTNTNNNSNSTNNISPSNSQNPYVYAPYPPNIPYLNQFNLGGGYDRKNFPWMMQDNTEILNKLTNTDDAIFQDLMKDIKEKEKQISEQIDALTKITIETDKEMKDIKDKQDGEWKDKSEEINKEFQKKSKELKFNQNNFEEGTEANTGITKILSSLITNMDTKGDIDINDYDDIKDELGKYLDAIEEKIKNKDYKYDETKAFYRKMISLLKQSITPENMKSSDIKERIKTINTNVINRTSTMGAIEGFIRAIMDFFRKLSSVYKDLYEATSDFSEMTDMIIKLCNDFGKAKTREEKEEIAKQVINTFASLKNTILSLSLTPQEQESFKKIEELVKKLNKSSVNVADFATNFMRVIGAQATNKAFELSGKLQNKSDVAEKREFFTKKILEDIQDRIKNVNKATFVAIKYVGDGKESKIDTNNISEQTGISEETIKEIMNGSCHNEIFLINKKQKAETSNSKAEYDAMEYIIEESKMAKKKVEKYQSIIENFSKTYQNQIATCLQKITEQKTIHEEFELKYSANDILNVIRDINEKKTLLDDIDSKIKSDLKYTDNIMARKEKIEEDNNKIEKIKQQLKNWEKDDQDKIEKQTENETNETIMIDKNDKAEELSKIRGLISDLKSSVEIKFKGYEAIHETIRQLKIKLQDIITDNDVEQFKNNEQSAKTLNERYSDMTKEKITNQTSLLDKYANLRQASTSNRGRH